MTRISGMRIVKPPCCGKLFLSSNYSSMNFSASEFWTDGHNEHSLMPNTEGLRQCECGTYFVMQQTISIGDITLPERPPTFPKRKFRVPLIWRWLGQPDYDAIKMEAMAEYDRAFEAATDGYSIAVPVGANNLSSVVHIPGQDELVELAARRLYWRHLNAEYRQTYRDHRETKQEVFAPPYIPSDLQLDNMTRLVRILERHPVKRHLELAELHREMGNFEKARTFFDSYEGDDTRFYNALEHCLNEGLNGPVRYPA